MLTSCTAEIDHGTLEQQLPANAVLTPVLPQGGADAQADAAGNASIALGAQAETVYRVH